MRIKDMDIRSMPRERLLRYGTDKLSLQELLAIILGSGTKRNNVLNLSKQVLARIHTYGIHRITAEHLASIRGIGPTKILQIRALLAFATRLTEETSLEILGPKDIFNLCTDIRASKREHFLAFYFNTQNQLIERNIISIGTLNSSLVHPREVFEPALRLSAASVIVAHNHPSGSLTPSPQDFDVTERLMKAGELLGVPLIDHILVTSRSFTSLLSSEKSG